MTDGEIFTKLLVVINILILIWAAITVCEINNVPNPWSWFWEWRKRKKCRKISREIIANLKETETILQEYYDYRYAIVGKPRLDVLCAIRRYDEDDLLNGKIYSELWFTHRVDGVTFKGNPVVVYSHSTGHVPPDVIASKMWGNMLDAWELERSGKCE